MDKFLFIAFCYIRRRILCVAVRSPLFLTAPKRFPLRLAPQNHCFLSFHFIPSRHNGRYLRFVNCLWLLSSTGHHLRSVRSLHLLSGNSSKLNAFQCIRLCWHLVMVFPSFAFRSRLLMQTTGGSARASSANWSSRLRRSNRSAMRMSSVRIGCDKTSSDSIGTGCARKRSKSMLRLRSTICR